MYALCTPPQDLAPAAGSDIILFCNPNNPTGACATRAQLTTLVEFAIANKQMIVYDSAYAPFIQDPDKPKSIFEIPGAKTCAIESSSLSKLAGFTVRIRCSSACALMIQTLRHTRYSCSRHGMAWQGRACNGH